MAFARDPEDETADTLDALLARLTSAEWDALVDRIVDALEDRILGEVERRGGRLAERF